MLTPTQDSMQAIPRAIEAKVQSRPGKWNTWPDAAAQVKTSHGYITMPPPSYLPSPESTFSMLSVDFGLAPSKEDKDKAPVQRPAPRMALALRPRQPVAPVASRPPKPEAPAAPRSRRPKSKLDRLWDKAQRRLDQQKLATQVRRQGEGDGGQGTSG